MEDVNDCGELNRVLYEIETAPSAVNVIPEPEPATVAIVLRKSVRVMDNINFQPYASAGNFKKLKGEARLYRGERESQQIAAVGTLRPVPERSRPYGDHVGKL